MKTPDVVRRLVKELSELPEDDEGEEKKIPLEYYEFRELASNRVLLKSSLKTHFFVYLLVNIFLVVLNFLEGSQPLHSLESMWSLWPILGWGLILFSHALIVWSINIIKLESRIFLIVSLSSVYILGFLVFINYFVTSVLGTDYYWWYWPAIAIALFIAGYAWIVFYSENRDKKEKKIIEEMERLKTQVKEEETQGVHQDNEVKRPNP